MSNIALLGGSFDPVHLGHLQVAETVIHAFFFDEVWFVPSANHPFKHSTFFTFAERVQLLKLALATNPLFSVYEYDFSPNQKSYTLYLVKKIQEEYPQHHFSFIIGADNVTQLATWYGIDELLKQIPFIVVNRFNTEQLEWDKLSYFRQLSFVEMPLVNISSAEIRDLITTKQEFSHLIPKEIINIISQIQ